MKFEIEVTDEMIMAGLSALPYLPFGTLDSVSAETLVSEVYRAMRECEPGRTDVFASLDMSGFKITAIGGRPK